MPYITADQRARFDCVVEELVTELTPIIGAYPTFIPGELNYVISSIVAGILKEHGTSYTLINNITGVLECVKMELYRRVASHYEDKKIMENGDVY